MLSKNSKLLTIGIGGSKSSVGKTAFIESFITAIKKANKKTKVISIKYTKISQFGCIITDFNLIDSWGKDTARMKRAGADYVYWVKASEKALPQIAKKLKEEISQYLHSKNNEDGTVVVLEGNSLVRVMHSDVIIFIKGNPNEQIKPSGKAILNMADMIIENDYSIDEIIVKIKKIKQKN
jgi:LAO/AO transport system kinase